MSKVISARAGPLNSHLQWLRAAMRQACDRLLHFPSTYRDAISQVRETQRYYLMAEAFMLYHDHIISAMYGEPRSVRKDLMGAFSTDPTAVQKLHAAGVPVWFVRPDISLLSKYTRDLISVTNPDTAICVATLADYHLFKGLSGPRHIQATARGGHTYRDISTAPLLAVYSDGGYQHASSQSQYKQGSCGAMTVPIHAVSPVQPRSGPSRNNNPRLKAANLQPGTFPCKPSFSKGLWWRCMKRFQSRSERHGSRLSNAGTEPFPAISTCVDAASCSYME